MAENKRVDRINISHHLVILAEARIHAFPPEADQPTGGKKLKRKIGSIDRPLEFMLSFSKCGR
jgi:hypothetical protein